MNLTPVIDMLRQRIGLNPDALGATTLPRAVTARMDTLGLTAPELYAARLARDAQELQLLLGDIAVPETWFFRGGEIFSYLAGQIANVVREGRSLFPRKYRILSVPCSTGEEPYSLAIALAEAGVAPAFWEIEAIDLSAGHIDHARRARFGSFSFRQTTPRLRDCYFRPVEGDWELDPAIRVRVRFRQGNLLDPLFLADEEPFDLVLCRNLFIYLAPDARQRALNTLARLLGPDGLLGTGHAEPLDFQEPNFTRTGPNGYFLYRRAPGEVAKPSGREEESAPKIPNSDVHHPTTSPPHHPAPPLASAELSPPVDLLVRARQEADGGQLTEALISCQGQLAHVGPSADLYSLMGAIHQARQERDEAVRCYQRALYLEPKHTEALAQLMLLCQEQGDDTQAGHLRRRLQQTAAGGDA